METCAEPASPQRANRRVNRRSFIPAILLEMRDEAKSGLRPTATGFLVLYERDYGGTFIG